MTRFCLAVLSVLLFPVTPALAGGDDLNLSRPEGRDLFLFPQRLIATPGGASTGEGTPGDVKPEVGLCYDSHHVEESGANMVLHKVHAQAGGKVKLAESVYLSAAAKLPLYMYEASETRGSGPPPSSAYTRQDFLRLSPSSLALTGEVGISLGEGAGLAFFYDQCVAAPRDRSLAGRPDETYGTRFIFRFR